jgi:hypothetical protein
MGVFLQEYENKVLSVMYEYCIEKDYIKDSVVLCNDGIMIDKDLFKNELLHNLEKRIKDKLNFENYFYFPVQVKYRKPTRDLQGRTVHRVGWKDISTFLSLVTRTGPPKGWCKHILVTNASSVSWKGTKGKKDWTIAKGSFEKCDRFFWLKMCGVQKEEKVERVKIVYDDSDDEDEMPQENREKVEEPKNTRDLREAWLNKNFK